MTDQKTEEKILNAAKEVFVAKGKSGARMQEIADKAGINKALLHYYHRSKDQLFRSVFQSLIKLILPRVFSVIESDLPLEAKIHALAEKYIDFLSAHPEMPLFMLNELQTNKDSFFDKVKIEEMIQFTKLDKQLQDAYEKGVIREISVSDFVINLISLLVFPYVGKPVYQRLFNISNDEFNESMQRRKEEIPKLVMNSLRP